jgi:hypothetical protein
MRHLTTGKADPFGVKWIVGNTDDLDELSALIVAEENRCLALPERPWRLPSEMAPKLISRLILLDVIFHKTFHIGAITWYFSYLLSLKIE